MVAKMGKPQAVVRQRPDDGELGGIALGMEVSRS